MSDTKKTAAKVPAKENIAANLKKWVNTQLSVIRKSILSIEQVQNIVREVVSEQTPSEESVRVFRVNVRWNLPSFGGIPMPPNVCFYGFATFDYTEVAPGAGIDFEAIHKDAIEGGALEEGLTVESFSVYP